MERFSWIASNAEKQVPPPLCRHTDRKNIISAIFRCRLARQAFCACMLLFGSEYLDIYQNDDGQTKFPQRNQQVSANSAAAAPRNSRTRCAAPWEPINNLGPIGIYTGGVPHVKIRK